MPYGIVLVIHTESQLDLLAIHIESQLASCCSGSRSAAAEGARRAAAGRGLSPRLSILDSVQLTVVQFCLERPFETPTIRVPGSLPLQPGCA